MNDEERISGWLPPHAPGAQPAPLFEPAPPEPEPDPVSAPAAPAAERPPIFQTQAQPGNGAATTALVLGIVGMLLVVFTAGAGFLFSIPTSIAAWILGVQGRRRVASGQTATGDGIAHAGMILGIAGVVLGIVGMIVWIVLIASGLDLEELRRDLERQSQPNGDQALWLRR